MLRKSLVICLPLVFAVALATARNTPPSQPDLSAAEIANKNVAASGGLQAWRAVQTMSMTGKLGAGGNQRATLPLVVPDQPSSKSAVQVVPRRPAEEAQLPFVMDLARVRKMRLEIQFNGKTAVQVFDGANGWKLRPFLNRNEVEPYTNEEIKATARQQDLDGPLVDYAAKGTKIELEGTEKVEDRNNYKLKLTLKNGDVMHVWIDAQTFLESKIEGQPRRLDGVDHPVEIYYRDYRAVNGLQVPFLLETRVLPVANAPRQAGFPSEKIIVEKVTVNPKLDDALFTKPASVAAPKATPAVVKH
jgi:hypothetical protein